MGPSTPPPYVWVTPWSANVNLLTPEQSMLTTLGAPAGQTALAEGGFTPSARTFASLSYGTYVTVGTAPVVPGRPVTGSVRVGPRANSKARVAIDLLDGNGAQVFTAFSAEISDATAGLVPASVTIPAASIPAEAVTARLTMSAYVAARAQITWTAAPVVWGMGDGVAGVDVVLESVDPSVIAPGYSFAEHSFTVREVG